jgi:hypothetical protein
MPFELEKKLYDALKASEGISHRLEMCNSPTCKVCPEIRQIRETAQKVIREFEEKYGIEDLPF